MYESRKLDSHSLLRGINCRQTAWELFSKSLGNLVRIRIKHRLRSTTELIDKGVDSMNVVVKVGWAVSRGRAVFSLAGKWQNILFSELDGPTSRVAQTPQYHNTATMPTKSKLKMALAAEKGIDFGKQHLKKKEKAINKLKKEKSAKEKSTKKGGDKKPTEEDWEDVVEEDEKGDVELSEEESGSDEEAEEPMKASSAHGTENYDFNFL